MKNIFWIVIAVAAIALIGMWLVNKDTATLIGGDQDEHGCYLMAGYNWCESKQKCVRYWEEGCGDCEVDSDCAVFGKTGECNCGCYDKDMMPTSSEGECFCAAPTSCKCVDKTCEGVFE